MSSLVSLVSKQPQPCDFVKGSLNPHPSSKRSKVTSTSQRREVLWDQASGFSGSGFLSGHHGTIIGGPGGPHSNRRRCPARTYSPSGWNWDLKDSECEADDEGDPVEEPLRRSVRRSKTTHRMGKTTQCHMCKKKKPEGEVTSILVTNITNRQPHPWCLECRTKYSDKIEDDPHHQPATDFEGIGCIGLLVPCCATSSVKSGLRATSAFLKSEGVRDTGTQLLSVVRDMWRGFARGNGSHYS